MGISPVTNIALLLAPQPVAVSDVEVRAQQRVENSVSIGDETYSPSEGRSESDDDGEEEMESQAEETNSEHRPASKEQTSGISFFA